MGYVWSWWSTSRMLLLWGRIINPRRRRGALLSSSRYLLFRFAAFAWLLHISSSASHREGTSPCARSSSSCSRRRPRAGAATSPSPPPPSPAPPHAVIVFLRMRTRRATSAISHVLCTPSELRRRDGGLRCHHLGTVMFSHNYNSNWLLLLHHLRPPLPIELNWDGVSNAPPIAPGPPTLPPSPSALAGWM